MVSQPKHILHKSNYNLFMFHKGSIKLNRNLHQYCYNPFLFYIHNVMKLHFTDQPL